MQKLTVTTDSHVGACSLSPIGWCSMDIELEVINSKNGKVSTFHFRVIPAEGEFSDQLVFPPATQWEDNGPDGVSIYPPSIYCDLGHPDCYINTQ